MMMMTTTVKPFFSFNASAQRMPTIHFLHLLPPKMQKLHSEVLKKLIAHFSVKITKINEIFAEKTNFTIKSRVYARRNGLNGLNYGHSSIS